MYKGAVWEGYFRACYITYSWCITTYHHSHKILHKYKCGTCIFHKDTLRETVWELNGKNAVFIAEAYRVHFSANMEES